MRPRTIQIQLPSGDPRGIRVADLTTSIVRVIEVPRPLLADFFAMPEAKQVGFYFLVAGEDGGTRAVYIGQTGDLVARLTSHNKEKDFWNRALVVVSLTNSLTQTHALYLEWKSLKAASAAGRYGVENGTGGSRPHVPGPMQADCDEIFEIAGTLVATLGQPLFEPLTKPTGVEKDDVFYCAGAGVEARGELTTEGFVVLKDSKARLDLVPVFKGTREEKRREKLIEDKVLTKSDYAYVFTRDFLFSSPSAASSTVLGRPSNGWDDWKDKSGKTLHEVKRAPLEQSQPGS